MRAVLAPVILAVLGLALAGCDKLQIAELEHGVTPTPVDVGDRQDCDAILGTAFRSDTERAWFAENCSEWARSTLGPVEGGIQTSERSASQQRSDDRNGEDRREGADNGDDMQRRCNEMRGRPYQQPGDRDWYLQNCLNRPGPNQANNRNQDDDRNEDRDGNQDEDNDGNHRDGDDDNRQASWDCDSLRGRPYESPQQREWFLANCMNQGGSNNGPSTAGPPIPSGVGPNGRTCAQIYGTLYQSAAERSWFNQNCPH